MTSLPFHICVIFTAAPASNVMLDYTKSSKGEPHLLLVPDCRFTSSPRDLSVFPRPPIGDTYSVTSGRAGESWSREKSAIETIFDEV